MQRKIQAIYEDGWCVLEKRAKEGSAREKDNPPRSENISNKGNTANLLFSSNLFPHRIIITHPHVRIISRFDIKNITTLFCAAVFLFPFRLLCGVASLLPFQISSSLRYAYVRTDTTTANYFRTCWVYRIFILFCVHGLDYTLLSAQSISSRLPFPPKTIPYENKIEESMNSICILINWQRLKLQYICFCIISLIMEFKVERKN